jgi:hypothetical protein
VCVTAEPCPPGDWDAGERGLAWLPGRHVEFRAGIHHALACPRIHVMAGLMPAGETWEALLAGYVACLRWAATPRPGWLAPGAGQLQPVGVRAEDLTHKEQPTATIS